MIKQHARAMGSARKGMVSGASAGISALAIAAAMLVAAPSAQAQTQASVPADAQPVPTAPAKPAATPAPAEPGDIVVTATRRDALLSKVPISLSAFSEKRVDQLGIKNFADVARFTPGVAISQSNSGNDNIAIRGVSSNAGAATTGIYIDDTPIQIRQLGLNSNGAAPIIFDLDRVEVLRGPQGTLFGSGSEGGTVRYITPAPNLERPTVYARSEVSATQYGSPSYETGVSVGTPLVVDHLAARVSAYYREDGGYINRIDAYSNTLAQKDANSVDALALRAAVAWAPTNNLTIAPSIQYQSRLNHGTDVGGYYLGLSNPASGDFNEATPTPMQDRDHFILAAVKLDWNIGAVKLISNTSYFDRTENVNGYDGTTYALSYFQHSLDPNAPGYGLDPSGVNCTNTPAGIQGIFGYDANGNPIYGSGANPASSCTLNAGFLGKSSPLLTAQGLNPAFVSAFQAANNGQNYQGYNLIINKQQNFTQEVRLQSTATGSKLDWTAGIFYSHIKQQSNERIYDPQLDAISQLLYGEGILAAWAVPLLPGGYDYQNLGNSVEWQVAGFADATYAITPKLKANVGLRWAKTHFSFNDITQGPEAFGSRVSPPLSQGDTPLTPKFNLSWQVTPGDLIYATVSKGFRPGGANAPLLSACGVTAPLSFNSDSLWNYEGGAKLKLFGGAVRLASSAYLIKWSNIQQSVYVTACGQQFVGNLGALTSKGLDFQLEAHPARHLSMDLAVGYTHARYTRDSIIPANPDPNLASSNALVVGLTGDSVPGAPWTIAAGLQYDFNLGKHTAFVRFDDEYASHNGALLTATDPGTRNVVNYSSGMAQPPVSTNTISYDPNLVADPATNDASMRLGMNFGIIDAALFVNNLFDAHPQINLAHQDQWAATYTASTFRPRTFGLFLSAKY